MGDELAGVNVIAVGTGPACFQAATTLADFGASVTQVRRPGGGRFADHPAMPFWNRGSVIVELDLDDDDDRNELAQLVGHADAMLVAGRPARLRSWGLDAPTLQAEHPTLIHTSITGWGWSGPLADLHGYEALVAALSGRMEAFEVQRREQRPVYAAVQVATHLASQAAVQGIASGLVYRARTGEATATETSLLQALQCFDLVDMLSHQLAVRNDRTYLPLREAIAMPTLNYHPLRTKDDRWIQCGNLLEHLFMSFLDATELLGELMIDERFQLSPAQWAPEAIEEARDRMLLRMRERTADEWMAVFEASGNVAAEPIVTTADALRHRDVAVSLVEVDDPVRGPTTQIGPIAHVTAVAGDAAASPAPNASEATADEQHGPLSGVRILDLSTIIAGPLGVSMLADLGADVLKVEPLGGDPFRHLNIEGRMAVKTNANKRSISINLKEPLGQALVHEMVADADVLVHNFRGEVPARLGIDAETLHAINPRLIVASISGYSPRSEAATRPATHPVIGAASGGVALQAGPALHRDCPDLESLRDTAREIMAANEANPDPNTSVVLGSSITLALAARSHDGQGRIVTVDMQTANAWANGDDFLDYPGKPERQTPDDELLGLSATYRLYPTSDGWIFLAVTTDAEFDRLAKVLDAEGTPVRPTELEASLTEAFAAHDADAWQTKLSAVDVGCVRADGIETGAFWWQHEHVVANGWAPVVNHTRFGQVRRWGPLSTVPGHDVPLGPAPLAGEHTDEVLTSLGRSADEISQLREQRIVSSEPVDAV